MITDFIILALVSTAIGIGVALLGALILKIIPRHKESDLVAFREATLVCMFGYFSYAIAETFTYSGVIALFCCGFTIAHYGFYNLSEEG